MVFLYVNLISCGLCMWLTTSTYCLWLALSRYINSSGFLSCIMSRYKLFGCIYEKDLLFYGISWSIKSMFIVWRSIAGRVRTLCVWMVVSEKLEACSVVLNCDSVSCRHMRAKHARRARKPPCLRRTFRALRSYFERIYSSQLFILKIPALMF